MKATQNTVLNRFVLLMSSKNAKKRAKAKAKKQAHDGPICPYDVLNMPIVPPVFHEVRIHFNLFLAHPRNLHPT